MANEKRLIDVNVPIRDLTAMKSMYDAISLDGIIKALNNTPTVDAVEVVRCKDCKHSKVFTVADDPMYNHLRCRRRENYTEGVDGYDFCSYGKRREGK